MDIYKKILAELGIEQLDFDENNICTFEIEQSTKSEGRSFVVNIISNPSIMEIAISVTATTEIPEHTSKSLFTLLGEHALGPLRNDYGVGIFPDTNFVSTFITIKLSDYCSGQIKMALSELIEKAQQWDDKVRLEQHTPQESIAPLTYSQHPQNVLV